MIRTYKYLITFRMLVFNIFLAGFCVWGDFRENSIRLSFNTVIKLPYKNMISCMIMI